METRDLGTAQHEAAHVVVGCAVGLRFRVASAREHWDPDNRVMLSGGAYFTGRAPREAWALMFAAGIAWDRLVGAPEWWHEIDEREARKLVQGACGLVVIVRAARAMLGELQREHARVTRALLERDVTGAEVLSIAMGERPEDV